MKKMFTRNKTSEFNLFRVFFVGPKGHFLFPEGVVYEGVSEEPKKFIGSSAGLDMFLPTMEILFGMDTKISNRNLEASLQEMRTYLPN